MLSTPIAPKDINRFSKIFDVKFAYLSFPCCFRDCNLQFIFPSSNFKPICTGAAKHYKKEKAQKLGETAVYILYAHARICSIIKNSGKDIQELKKDGEIVLDHTSERTLALHLLRFSEIIEEACCKLLPNVLCKYLYILANYVSNFIEQCKVNGSAEETSRLLLCDATSLVMRKCLELLGITPVYKI